jgi:hypothetical protein
LGLYPQEELLGHVVVLLLISLGISILFSTMAVQICIPTNSVLGFPFLHILVKFVLSCFCFCFYNSHLYKYEVYLSGLNWIFFIISDIEDFPISVGSFLCFFRECMFSSFAHFFIGLFVYLLLSYRNSLQTYDVKL